MAAPKVGFIKRATTSITDNGEQQKETKVVEQKEITQELLDRLWLQFAETKRDETKIYTLLKNAPVHFVDQKIFNIEITNIYSGKEIDSVKTEMLAFMRENTGHPALNCKYYQVRVEHETLAYSPQEKFLVMQEVNPNMVALKQVFGDIDY